MILELTRASCAYDAYAFWSFDSLMRCSFLEAFGPGSKKRGFKCHYFLTTSVKAAFTFCSTTVPWPVVEPSTTWPDPAFSTSEPGSPSRCP